MSLILRAMNMKLYTLPDAAEALGIDLETLQAWMADTQIQPAIDASQQPVIAEEQIKQMARQHSTGSLPDPAVDGTSALAQVEVPEVRPIELNAPIVSIGRQSDNMVVLNHPQVSTHHARLERLQDGTYRLIDLHSTNHVYVNGQRVKFQVLQPGDQVGIGPFQFAFTGQE
ncbi:MAG TPA: FHA domain-containing protein, partial [Ktedonobacteraceae bacterium]|nr:FHA domain-containing protein [Ktedonobacteraceae bacterium]